jgi:outer membrane translocation and assembly module TamA
VRAPFSDWTLLRVLPDARVYLPLPFDMVLAARFALGMLFVLDARSDLDDTSRELGPTTYRLRGGGAQSNRGFIAGQLGDGVDGGQRRWESSLELRMRLGRSFGFVLFYDMGDVSRGSRFRFDEPNPAAGFGFRYITFVGAIRADLGFRLGDVEDDDRSQDIFGTPGALHLTLGEAF